MAVYAIYCANCGIYMHDADSPQHTYCENCLIKFKESEREQKRRTEEAKRNLKKIRERYGEK